jgi:ABC-type multidrug transport system ATPase subunit
MVTRPDGLPAFRVVDLVKRYPGRTKPATDGISLEINAGEVFGVLGGNGAGKTTLVRQMLNLALPSSGAIELFGKDVRSDSRYVQRRVGYQAQQGTPLPHLTLEQALKATGQLRGLGRRGAAAESKRLIDLWNLDAVARRPMSRLSGGEQRLGHIALAMAGRPPVMVLDEPTSGLDPGYRHRAWEILLELGRSEAVTVVLVTHDAVEAEKIVDRVALIREGKVAATGRPKDLKGTLDGKLRLELSFDPTASVRLPRGPEWHQKASGRHFTLLHPGDVPTVLAQIDLAELDSLKLYSTTLEDLYFRYASP